MKLLVISVLAWLAGLAAYIAALWLLWGQTIHDLTAVVVWSGLAAAVAVAVGFAPVMFVLRNRLAGRRAGAWAFPLVGCLLGVVPVVLITAVWSSDLWRALFSPEAGLFSCMFSIFGATFGEGFFLAYGRRSA